ncbi:MAG TPA: MBL fold metallo-hydrolase, partial [Abditibacteriaceae bacterium]|nr:MBL fold metallo-hydrolase [Abditibacteriaceae bacterium]
MSAQPLHNPLHIESFVVGPLPNNLYLLRDDQTRQMVVVDPSIESDDAINRVLDLQREGYTLNAIWNTHGHFDHIYDNARWKSQFQAPLLMHQDDEWLIERLPDTAVLMAGLPEPQTATPDGWLHDGQQLQLGNFSCEVLLVPGHSPGSVAFWFPSENVCLSGDVLFKGSAGRTDFSGCDPAALPFSLARLCALPDSTRILPGHGAETTIKHEKATNPFCQNL